MKRTGLLWLSLFSMFFAACKQNDAATETVRVTGITNDKITLSNGETIDLPNEPGTGATTLFLVRHGEKEEDTGDTNPGLTQAGRYRASRLDSLLANVQLGGVLATPTRRTMETAEPVAARNQVQVMNYETKSFERLYQYVFDYEKGKKFLVVGHSNTLPELILNLIPNATPIVIADDDYDDFYVITGDGRGNAKLYSLAY